ncbi:hypothetical protein K9N68_25725 [Kovacikia minuta CCNUW1]|uniref:hypothetical protein n=1 Tax=Kovacikia minuta TaxID=2931930 RepID=UPI001CCE31D2|nr:hypothetical protein [Kovacikia minuta]UBF25008.1 hypothetical protein K9N68_25725 [Kovacikia minuta CCNUW1]
MEFISSITAQAVTLNDARFLDSCTERFLRSRIGERDRFIHELLPDYFAGMGSGE